MRRGHWRKENCDMRRALATLAVAAATLASASSQVSDALASPEETVFEASTEHCVLKASADYRGTLLRLDVTPTQAEQTCAFSKRETVALISGLFAAISTHDKGTSFHSLMLGQIESYSWLQQHLIDTAREDAAWSQAKAKPTNSSANDYVNQALSRSEALGIFNEAAQPYGYSFAAASCEKVFISSDGLPFNAFCWLTIAP